jgi:hypothetical protein
MRTVLLALALGACFVPPHRFDDPPPPDGAPPPDAPPVLFVTIPSGVSIQGGSSALELPEPMTNYDSQPVHRVFTSSYEITAGCVTEQQYFECVKGGGCPETPGDGGQIGLGLIDDTHADAYCRFIGARVPTEAELERAVRGDMGAKTLSTPSPFGLDSCDLGETTVIVADHYQCDAYVGRAWANPLAGGTGLHARLFQTDLVDAPIPPRTAKSPVYGIRCVRSLDATAPPLPPAQPTCTTGCDVSQLAIGEHFGCALRASGEVWCWGSNTDGELGTDDLVDAIPSSTAPRHGNGCRDRGWLALRLRAHECGRRCVLGGQSQGTARRRSRPEPPRAGHGRERCDRSRRGGRSRLRRPLERRGRVLGAGRREPGRRRRHADHDHPDHRRDGDRRRRAQRVRDRRYERELLGHRLRRGRHTALREPRRREDVLDRRDADRRGRESLVCRRQ